MGHQVPLSTWATKTQGCDSTLWHDKCRGMVARHSYSGKGWGWGGLLLAFIIVVVIIWLILWAAKPEFVQKKDHDHKKTGEVDGGKALVSAIVFAVILCLILWAVAY